MLCEACGELGVTVPAPVRRALLARLDEIEKLVPTIEDGGLDAEAATNREMIERVRSALLEGRPVDLQELLDDWLAVLETMIWRLS